MLEFDMPTTIRMQFESDKQVHETYCDEGYIVHINQFTLHMTEEKCQYCAKFHKERFDGDY